jgi:hypothetical protein
MRSRLQLMAVLGFVAVGVGCGVVWAQIPAVVTLPVNDGRRVELKDMAGLFTVRCTTIRSKALNAAYSLGT